MAIAGEPFSAANGFDGEVRPDGSSGDVGHALEERGAQRLAYRGRNGRCGRRALNRSVYESADGADPHFSSYRRNRTSEPYREEASTERWTSRPPAETGRHEPHRV
ncbi:MAG: hypothetical protein ACC645_17780 [Pirellulales bacterium]